VRRRDAVLDGHVGSKLLMSQRPSTFVKPTLTLEVESVGGALPTTIV
jgi:hypothetical protein